MKKILATLTAFSIFIFFAPFAHASTSHTFTCADGLTDTFSSVPSCSGAGTFTFANASESIGDWNGGVKYPVTSGVTYYFSGVITGTGSVCVINNNGGHQSESAGTFTDVPLSSTNGNRGWGMDNRGGSSQCGAGNLNGTASSMCITDTIGGCQPAVVTLTSILSLVWSWRIF